MLSKPNTIMQTAKLSLMVSLVTVLFLLQILVLNHYPSWWTQSHFPMTILGSVIMPTVLGITAGLAIVFSHAEVQRRLLYSIIVACVIELVATKIMLWLHQPAVVILVLLMNAFITVQFLRYGTNIHD